MGSAAGGLLAQTPLSGGAAATQYGVPDQLGSTRLLTDASGQTTGTFAYDAFGKPKASGGANGGTATTPLGFTGQLTDTTDSAGAGAGLQDLRARLYDPTTGQFLQRDTYVGNATAPATLNRFTYAGDQPTVYSDPSGHCAEACVDSSLGSVGDSFSMGSGASLSGGLGGGSWVLGSGGTPVSATYQDLVPSLTAFTRIDWGAALKTVGLGLLVTVGVGLTLLNPASLALVVGAGLASGLGQLGLNALQGHPLLQGVGNAAFEGATIGLQVAMLFDGLGAAADLLDLGVMGAVDAGEEAAPLLAEETTTAVEDGAERAAADEEGTFGEAGEGGGCSFSADTSVATPDGARAISSLKVGDQVIAYDPTTGQAEAEPVQHTWRNHDHDLVDVTLQVAVAPTPKAASTSSASTATAIGAPSQALDGTHGHGMIRQVAQVAQVAMLIVSVLAGSIIPLTSAHGPMRDLGLTGTARSSQSETIHTTSNHPWLTADRGWVAAGHLRPGEAVVTLYGTRAVVEWVHVVPGQADYYNLTITKDHTYVVGSNHAIVHNTCQPTEYGGPGGGHHILAKKAFQDVDAYDPNAALAISNVDMEANGWYHPAMTAKQQQLFRELGKGVVEGTMQNTMREHARIAVEALIAGNVPETEARSLVARSLWNLRSMGVRAPNWIPWVGGPYPGIFG